MWDLFKAEILRFRSWAIAYAALQLVLLGFMSRVVDMAQQPLLVYEVIGGLYGLSGLLLGLYQMGGYRRPNTWLNLLHRPMPSWRIAAALYGAGALLLAIAVLLPLLVLAGWQESMTARVVDTRHLLLALSGWLVALCAYLAGSYAMLANKRYSFCALVFVLLLVFYKAVGMGAIAVQCMALAFLAAMNLTAFKPDLDAAPRNLAGIVVTALPLQMAMWFALVMVGFGVEFVWIAQGSHPNNMAVPLPGGEKEAENAEAKDLMIAGLRNSADPQAPLWREQAGISEMFGIESYLRAVPVRNELTNLAPMEFDDTTRRIRWVFSHDDMRFHGYSLVDKRPVGTLGVAGQQPFPSPPLPGPDSVFFTGDTVYQYYEDDESMLPRAHLPSGEVVTGYGKVGDDLALLSNRGLYFYDVEEFKNDDGVLTPRQRVPLPGKPGDLIRIELMELLDGWLGSFTYTRRSYNAEGALPFQQLIRVDSQGHVAHVARRDLILDYPVAWRYQNWYTSPALYSAQRAIARLFSGYLPDEETDRPAVPRSARTIAAVLMLLSLLGAVWRTRQTALAMPARIAWIVVCGAVGLPALMSLWLIHPKREALEDLPLAQAATA
ncbi:hypothetical protein [Pseudoxanthomonas sp. CF125]|uniref:hypothetical protein n=1 Tax=Pseudoxanthomonas sp. CF125 TaxID=1855303 RepID=UPI00087E3603|nr:hypothetical protein [Pseudoxanthomonas sp. CF125]SDQ28027.1 hypothetical protein SAMN05216569_0440 [Pseudoxanthomonas sp. CF125]